MAKQTFTTGQVLTAAQMTSLQQTAMLGGAASAKTSSYTLVAADAGDAITMSNAGATTITVNTGLFAAGDIVTIINIGAGVCTITAGTATVTTSGSLALAQNQGGVLRFTSTSAAIFLQFATPASGDIEGVTAGVGISGGGTSGTVTITNSMATAIDAKGDLVAGTGADTFSRLAVGANDTVLTADSAQATGLKWATVSAGGLTLISTTTLSGTQTNLTSIPGTYKSLLLRVTGSYGSTSGNLTFRFNNDATNPAYAVNSTSAFQTGYSISGLGGTSITAHYCFNTSVGTTNIVELYLPNYASTATKKYAMIQGATRQNGTSNIDLGLMSAYWDNTAAVTQINILGLGTFTAGTALLYGVN